MKKLTDLLIMGFIFVLLLPACKSESETSGNGDSTLESSYVYEPYHSDDLESLDDLDSSLFTVDETPNIDLENMIYSKEGWSLSTVVTKHNCPNYRIKDNYIKIKFPNDTDENLCENATHIQAGEIDCHISGNSIVYNQDRSHLEVVFKDVVIFTMDEIVADYAFGEFHAKRVFAFFDDPKTLYTCEYFGSFQLKPMSCLDIHYSLTKCANPSDDAIIVEAKADSDKIIDGEDVLTDDRK